MIPQGDQPQLGDGGTGCAGGGPARRRRGRRRLDGRAPAHRRGPRTATSSLYNVDHLLELWDEIHARLPHARLWLVGGASDRVRKLVSGPGRHRPFRPPAAGAGARDGGELRPRALPAHQGPGDPGRQGRRVHRPRRPDGLVRLRGDGEPARDGRRRPRADAARVRRRRRPARRGRARHATRSRPRRDARAAELDWDVLARRYEEEILDRWLPPRGDPAG